MTASPAATAREPNLTALAFKLCADLTTARPAIYWADLILTSLVAYAGFAGAVLLPGLALKAAAFVVSALAFYRGVSFLHEVTHLRSADVPGFKAGYNVLIGVPFLVPSLMYEGVHNLHHAKTRYGTIGDPEYMPLAHQSLWHVVAFVAISALAPVGLLIRFAVLTPIAALVPPFRRVVVERFSALAINPQFRREMPPASQLKLWLTLEALCSVWAITLITLTIMGVVSETVFWTGVALGSAVAVVEPDPDARRPSLGERGRGDDADRAVPRHGQRPAAGDAADAVGAGGPALPRAAPSAAAPALSQPRQGPCPADGGAARKRALREGNNRGFWEVMARLTGFIRAKRQGRPEIVPGE